MDNVSRVNIPFDRSHANSKLSDSWVNDISGSDADGEYLDEPPSPPLNPAHLSKSRSNRRSLRASPAAPDPELIMPSIHEDMGGSWVESNAAKPSKSRRRTKQASPSQISSTVNGKFPSKASPTKPKMYGENKDPPNYEIGASVTEILISTLTWLLEIAGGTLKMLKKPITLVLAIYLFAGLFTLMQNLLTNSIYAALSPICRIPGTALLNLPMCVQPSSNPAIDPAAPAEFDKLMTVQGQFEEMLSESTNALNLPFDMKRSETSVRDLRQVVIFSTIRSKNELLLEFDGFIETARIASYDLQKFNSHVGRSVDSILSVARWTQRVLDDMAIKQSTSGGAISSFFNSRIFAPFQPVQFTQSTLLDQYIKHTSAVGDEISRLLTEAQTLLQVLQSLEDRLEAIHSIAMRDNINAQASKDEILGQLWTILGGNRAKLDKFNKQLNLLRSVSAHRRVAWAHVSSAILKLQGMGAELEALRERVGSAESLPDHPEIPLSAHVDSIRLGVERLEAGRQNAREVERGFLRRNMDQAQEKEVQYMLDG